MKKIRNILAIAIAMIMIAGLVPANVFADGEDTREKINEIKLTANPKLESLAVIGKIASSPLFTINEGKPARVNYGMCKWLKKNGTNWEDHTGKTFTEGTYRYKLEIRIDGADAETNVFDENGVNFTVNDEAWGKFKPHIDTTSSSVWAISKEFVARDSSTPTNPEKPTVQGSTEFVYDESEKEVTLNGFDAKTMTLSGDVKKTDAGKYKLYVTSKTGT